jgi:hypothetical protein
MKNYKIITILLINHIILWSFLIIFIVFNIESQILNYMIAFIHLLYMVFIIKLYDNILKSSGDKR